MVPQDQVYRAPVDLPRFRYHPDPVATGSIQADDRACICCAEVRGFSYVPVLPIPHQEDGDTVCPWCIADGTAHRRFGAAFVDPDAVGGYGDWDTVPAAVVEEIAHRTPAFTSWQTGRWWTHCGDGAAFIGVAGAADVAAHGPITVDHLRSDLGWPDDAGFRAYIDALDADGQPTAYLFRCLVCAEVGGFSDFT
jgi:uncharacterized protein CbrC (UPF0167 family)